MLPVDALGLAAPAGDSTARLEPPHWTPAEPARGEDVNGDLVEQPGKAGAAIVGDQQYAVAAALSSAASACAGTM